MHPLSRSIDNINDGILAFAVPDAIDRVVHPFLIEGVNPGESRALGTADRRHDVQNENAIVELLGGR